MPVPRRSFPVGSVWLYPAAIVIVLAVVGAFAWKHLMAPAAAGENGAKVPGLSISQSKPPTTREEGMKMYRGGK